MGAALSAANKRSLEAPDVEAPDGILSQTDAPYAGSPSEPGAEAGREEEDVVDAISDLPVDAVVDTSTPLNLDHRDLQWPCYDEQDLAGHITRILASHPGPGRRLSVGAVHLHRQPALVDDWLQSPALDGLQELELDVGGKYELAPGPPLPAAVSRFAATLRAATIAKCHVPDGALCFPKLRQLGLEDVAISEGALHGIIAGCPALESLLLTGRSRFGCIRINSPSLVSVGLRVYTGELIVEHAPMLERLLQLEFRIATHLSVVSAPKLETVGCLCDIDFNSKLAYGAPVIQELSAVSKVEVVSSVKVLAINIHSLSIDMFVDLMRCFPYLEKLYIQTRNVSGHKDLWHHDVIQSLKIIRLKTVVLRKFQGSVSQVHLATFFILNAKMLELMRFEGRHCGTKKFTRELHSLLPLEKRASRGAQFHFTSTRCDHFIPLISHARDLSKTDLFKCDSECDLL